MEQSQEGDACGGLLIILFHGVMELLTNVLHIINPL